MIAILFLVAFLAAGALACMWVAAILDDYEQSLRSAEKASMMRDEWKRP